jgi:hypothetical protein
MASSPSEHEIQQRIRLACGRGPGRLWRNNTGALVDQQGRFGLCKGSSNMISHDHRLEQETSAPLMPDPPDYKGGRALRERNKRSGRPARFASPAAPVTSSNIIRTPRICPALCPADSCRQQGG